MSYNPSSKGPSDKEDLFKKIIGLGDSSPVKSYYPELQSKLKELEKFRFFLEGITDFVGVFDFKNGNLLTNSNKSFNNIIESDSLDLSKVTFNQVIRFQNSQKTQEVTEKFIEDNYLHLGYITTPSGKVIPIEFSLKLLENSDEQYIVFIGRDITERLEKEQMLKQLNSILKAELESLIQEKLASQEMLIKQSRMAAMGEMIGNIAHQWRQPLCSLGFIIQDLIDAYDSGDLNREYLSDIVESSMSQILFMTQTIENFRNYYSPNKEKLSFNIMQSVKDTINIIEKQFDINDVNLELKVINESPDSYTTFGYPNEFKQVLLNLLSNSLDAVADKGNKGVVKITITDTEKYIFLDIFDNGGGIPDDIIDKVFEPYFTTKDKETGTGLGLYMSKMIIEENMLGSLRVENTDDGACFTVKLLKIDESKNEPENEKVR